MSTTLALTIDQFFDTKQLFLQGLAFVLGIDLKRLHVVSVVPGSAKVDYLVYEEPAAAEQPIPEPKFDTSKNVDSSTAVGAGRGGAGIGVWVAGNGVGWRCLWSTAVGWGWICTGAQCYRVRWSE